MKRAHISLTSICFWRFMPKGEKVLAQSKRTAPPPISKSLKAVFQFVLKKFFNWYLIFYIISNWYDLFQNSYLKPSWTLRGECHWGRVLFSQRKSIWNRGRKFQILKMLRKNLIHFPLTICKRTLKRIYKRICKNKTCGASVVQNVKNWRNNPCISYKYLYWLNSKQPLHLHYAN